MHECTSRIWHPLSPQDFAKFDIQLRMVAARLPDGSLLLVSPIAPTAEALSLLAGLGGRVAHIVLPSSSPEHWCAPGPVCQLC